MMEPSTDLESNEELADIMNEPFSEDYHDDDPTVISLPGNLSTNRYENRNSYVTSLRTITYKGSFSVFNHDAAVVSPSPSPPPIVASSPLSSTLPSIPTLAPISDYRDDATVDFDPLFRFDPINDRLVPSPIDVEVVPPTPSPPPKDPSVAKSNLAKRIMVPKVKKKRIRRKEPKKKVPKVKKKRIRRKEPEKRIHVEKRDNDVLLGRGGCANNHQGNKIYLKHILGLQKPYKTLPRDEKTNCSNSVVQWIQKRGGRFLKREDKGSPWYIVTPATARQKVSQALREDHTPEGRALKKSKAKSYKH